MKKQLNPVTFEVRRQIKTLSTTLPRVPHLMKVTRDEKMIITTQIMKRSTMLSGKEILQRDPSATVNGKEIDQDSKYIHKGTEFRMMNHNVQLTKAYQEEGQLGIDKYVHYVEGLDAQIKESSKPKVITLPSDLSVNENKEEMISLESIHKEGQAQIAEADLPEGNVNDEPDTIKEV